MKRVVIPKEAAGQPLLGFLNQNGHSHQAPCGGKGTCGKCTVKVIEGRFANISDPMQMLLPDENGNLLACRAICTDTDAVIEFSPSEGEGLVIDEVKGDTKGNDGIFAVALDIGTTTLAAALVEKNKKAVIATASALNPQSGFGADVMSRIAASEEGNLDAMQRCLLNEISRLLQVLLQKAELPCDTAITELAVAGNPTMLHIFCGVSPAGMGRYPFTPAFLATKRIVGKELGLPFETVIVLPSASAFIGSDVLGGAVTKEMLQQDEPTLLVDIGTNGEMILCCGKKRGNQVFTTSAAAGPAFEGANISCGMGGVAGAVCKIEFEKDASSPVFYTVDDEKPKGLCGSGLVDFVAYLLKSGQMDETGYTEDDSIPLIGYHQTKNEKRFTKAGFLLQDKDIRSLQLAKSAIRAAVETLADYAGVLLSEISATYLAGGLGYYMDKASAESIGLLPSELVASAISVGNTSLGGAVHCLVQEDGVGTMQKIADLCVTVELNDTALFSELFMEHMMFPAE